MVMKSAWVSIVLLAATTVGFGQTTFNDLDGMTPVGLQPGSPAGSYALSGLDTINLYNGSNSITIPLLKIGGRGESGYTMVAHHDTHWDGTGISDETTSPSCSSGSPCRYWTFQLSGFSSYVPAAVVARSLGQAPYTIYST